MILYIVHPSLEEEAQHVLDIFQDRLLVAQCRAGCDLRYLGDHQHHQGADRGQCWTVCHLLASAPPVWARICESQASSVCGPGCQTACSLFRASDLEIMEAREEAEVSEGGLVRVTSAREAGAVVNILVARDRDGAWYELMQTPEREMEAMGDMVEAWVIRVTAGGVVSVISVKKAEHWELFLDHIEWDSGIYQVEVFWTKQNNNITAKEKVTVTWSLDTVQGVMVTTDTRVRLPVPPGARVTIQVRSEVTGAVSDSLTLEIPSTGQQEQTVSTSHTMSGSLLATVIFVGLLLFLAVTVGLVISLYRRTQRLGSSQSLHSVRVSSPSLTTEKNKSILSFDTFVTRNKIAVPEIVLTRENLYA